ncbi:MAG: DUF4905 domain-containing protein [Cytophagaceae bacterium]|nr:DUF4905 domain-containing protein [Cytophagaceae bacterium]
MPFGKRFAAQVEGIVWKLTFDRHGQAPAIGVEVRRREDREATWAVVDLVDNRLIWQNPAPDELAADEWLGMIGLYNGTLLLHRYGTDSPQPRGLLALDARTGTQRYELPGLVLLSTDGQRLVAARPANEGTTPRLTFDLATGEFFDAPISNQPASTVNLEFPRQYLDTNVHFPVVARFVQRLTGEVAVKAVNYLEISAHPTDSDPGTRPENAYLLVSYYIYDQDLLENRLLVVQGLNDIVLHETLSTGQGLNPEPFAIYTNSGQPPRLVFVQNQNRLMVYEC